MVLFKRLLIALLIVCGAILLVLAWFTHYANTEGGTSHPVFAEEFGIPGILLIVLGASGILWTMTANRKKRKGVWGDGR